MTGASERLELDVVLLGDLPDLRYVASGSGLRAEG